MFFLNLENQINLKPNLSHHKYSKPGKVNSIACMLMKVGEVQNSSSVSFLTPCIFINYLTSSIIKRFILQPYKFTFLPESKTNFVNL